MADTERAFITNEAKMAEYRRCGYESVWVSGAGCCKACTDLNGITLKGSFRPPLHGGCTCTVGIGNAINLTDDNTSHIIKIYDGSHVEHDKYAHNDDGTIVITDDWKESNEKIPRKYEPYAVIENKLSKTKPGLRRTYYDGEGYICLQIHGAKHVSWDVYPNEKGIHAHDFIDGSRDGVKYVYDGKNVDWRELTEKERQENNDIW